MASQSILGEELNLHQYRFPLTNEQWDNWKQDLSIIGVEVIVKSKQLLEDLELSSTEVIAEEGKLLFKEEEFSFTAQLSVAGWALDVGSLFDQKEGAKELSNYLSKHYLQGKSIQNQMEPIENEKKKSFGFAITGSVLMMGLFFYGVVSLAIDMIDWIKS